MKRLASLIIAVLLLAGCFKPASGPTEPWSFTEEIERNEYMVHYRTYFSNGLIVDRYTTPKEGDTQ